MTKRTDHDLCNAVRQESAEAKAGRIMEEEPRRLGWPDSELADRRNDPGQAGAGHAAASGDNPAAQVDCQTSAAGSIKKCQPEPGPMEVGPPRTRQSIAKCAGNRIPYNYKDKPSCVTLLLAGHRNFVVHSQTSCGENGA